MATALQVNNPATDEVIANVACMKAADTKSAIAAAAAAFPSWRSKTAKERGAVLRRYVPQEYPYYMTFNVD